MLTAERCLELAQGSNNRAEVQARQGFTKLAEMAADTALALRIAAAALEEHAAHNALNDAVSGELPVFRAASERHLAAFDKLRSLCEEARGE